MSDAHDPDDWWAVCDEGIRVTVRVQPNARKNEVAGVRDGALRVKLAAPPVDGKANDALRAYLAEVFSIRRSAVRIMLGSRARHKVVQFVGIERPPRRLERQVGRPAGR